MLIQPGQESSGRWFPKVYLNVTEKRRERAGARSQEIYQAASEALAAFEDRYDGLLTDAVKSFASYPP